MRILHVLFSLNYGGIETMLADLTRRQAETDDVTLMIINDVVDETLLATFDPRVKVERLGLRQGGNRLLLLLKVNRRVRRLRPDVIHCHNANAPGVIRGLDHKMVFTIHDEGISHRWLRPSMKYIAISDAVKADMFARAPKLNITTVLNGVETEAIRRRPFSQPEGEVKLVQVARLLYSKKGQDILIRALSMLPERFTLHLIGEGDDLEPLRQMARSMGVEQRVTFLGKRSRQWIYEHLADYDIMVHPSRYEGFGLTVAEGMAAALPVAVSDSGGPAEIVENGRLGELFAPKPEECAKAIGRIADNYQQALIRVTLALDTVRRRYSMARMTDAYRAIYIPLLECPV